MAKRINLEIFVSPWERERGTIPTGVNTGIRVPVSKVIGLRYEGRPDIVHAGRELPTSLAAGSKRDLYVPEETADRTYAAFENILPIPLNSYQRIAPALCRMAGVELPKGRVAWPGEAAGERWAWQQPAMGDLQINTGYLAVNANAHRNHWPYWVLADHTGALTVVPKVGLAIVHAQDMLRVGNFARPLAEIG